MGNPTAERALGTPAEEMQRDTLRDSFPSTIGSDVPAVLRDVVLSGQARELGELRSDDKPFSKRFFRLRAFPLRNDHVGVVFEDITERRSAEETVRRQAQLLDLAHDAIVRDPNGRVISWSHGAQRTYGWTKDEALGKAMHQRAPEIMSGSTSDLDPLSSGFRGMALSHGERVTWSTPILSAKGEVLGTLDICDSEPRRPLDKEERLVERAMHIAATGIESHRADLTLSQLSGRLLSLQDEERRRIARELHDSTG